MTSEKAFSRSRTLESSSASVLPHYSLCLMFHIYTLDDDVVVVCRLSLDAFASFSSFFLFLE